MAFSLWPELKFNHNNNKLLSVSFIKPSSSFEGTRDLNDNTVWLSCRHLWHQHAHGSGKLRILHGSKAGGRVLWLLLVFNVCVSLLLFVYCKANAVGATRLPTMNPMYMAGLLGFVFLFVLINSFVYWQAPRARKTFSG